MKTDKPGIFVGHCFDGESRVIKYRAIIQKIFTKQKYRLVYGTQESFESDGVFFNEIKRLIKRSQYCIFDLAGHNPNKSKLNLNVLLEAGVAIGRNRNIYLLSPDKGKCAELVKEISDLSERNIRWYRNRNHQNLKKVLSQIKKRIDQHQSQRNKS